MTDYLLDTNHTSLLVTIDHPLREKILKQNELGDTFAICVPVLTETLFGISILPRARQNLAEWQRLSPILPCYVPDLDDAVTAAEIQINLRRRGWQLATVDALIATIAIRYNLVLLTTDEDFKAIPALKRENWI